MDHGMCSQIRKAPTAKRGLVTSSISPIRSALEEGDRSRELCDNTAGSEITAGFSGYSYWQASALYGSVLPPVSPLHF
jgi:hypothetical protein